MIFPSISSVVVASDSEYHADSYAGINNISIFQYDTEQRAISLSQEEHRSSFSRTPQPALQLHTNSLLPIALKR